MLENDEKNPNTKVAKSGPAKAPMVDSATTIIPSTDSAKAVNPMIMTPINVATALVIVSCRLAFVSSTEFRNSSCVLQLEAMPKPTKMSSHTTVAMEFTPADSALET